MLSDIKGLRALVREVLDGFAMDAPSPAGNMRYDVAVRPNDGLATWEELDELDEPKALRRAACVLVVADDGTVLAVSRRDDPTMMGLPGGKVDPGETPEEAAARELKEETGLDCISLQRVFVADDGEYVTTTFACQVTGQIESDEEGVIRWVQPNVLIDPTTSPFADYNRQLFARLASMF